MKQPINNSAYLKDTNIPEVKPQNTEKQEHIVTKCHLCLMEHNTQGCTATKTAF